jgi:hypothetical protein
MRMGGLTLFSPINSKFGSIDEKAENDNEKMRNNKKHC